MTEVAGWLLLPVSLMIEEASADGPTRLASTRLYKSRAGGVNFP
jgi:hypothetical protein